MYTNFSRKVFFPHGLITVSASNGCGTSSNQYIDVTVLATSNTITLSSAAGTNNQSVCVNSAASNITYSTTASGATFSNLPTGVNGAYLSNTITISGTPTVEGTYNYIVNLTGGACNNNASGILTINPLNTGSLTSASSTTDQTLCINTVANNLSYFTTGATGASFSSLPPGLNSSFSSNSISVSGTPTSAGTYNYTITLTGGCGNITKTGTYTVNPNNTISLTSASGTDNQSKCISGTLTNITYSTTTATSASIIGLPDGVNGSWLSNVYTINGSSNASGTFNYTISLTGGCDAVTKTGTMIISTNTIPSAPSGSGSQSFCTGASPVISNLNATGTSILWYSNSTGGASLSNSATLTNSNHYYATQTVAGCESENRLDVTAIINTTPSINTSTSNNRCGTGTVSLSATVSAGNINWYDASTNGTLMNTGTNYTTPSISTTTIYYVDATFNGCTTISRTTVTATINNINLAVTGNLTQYDSVTLVASGGTSYTWSGGAHTSVNQNVFYRSGYYSVSGTDANSCSDTKVVFVQLKLWGVSANGLITDDSVKQVSRNGLKASILPNSHLGKIKKYKN